MGPLKALKKHAAQVDANVKYIRGLIGIPPDVIDEHMDSVICAALRDHRLYDDVEAVVRRRLKMPPYQNATS